MPQRQTYESYTVRTGDTLTAIAKRYGTTVAAIAATSGLADPNKIKAGQVLSIPVGTGYDADNLDLSEVTVHAQRIPTRSVDPVVALVNVAGEWLKPPRLFVTLAFAFGVGYYLLKPRRRRRRR